MEKQITVKSIQTKREMNDFVSFPDWLYRDCPYYVPDLRIDVRNMFNPVKNPGLEFTDIQPFVAYDRKGKVVGRIVGIINHRANEKWHTQNVRFGFIDFINDIEVTQLLLKAVEQWGRERGMKYIQGPMGITDFDKEGMLVEGFEYIGRLSVRIQTVSCFSFLKETLVYTP